MIARVWTGVVAADRLEAYVSHLEATGVGAYRRIAGNRAAHILTPDLGGGRGEVVAFSDTVGKDAVVAICENTLAGLGDTSVETSRLVSVADTRSAFVDTVSHYTDTSGETSTVALRHLRVLRRPDQPDHLLHHRGRLPRSSLERAKLTN